MTLVEQLKLKSNNTESVAKEIGRRELVIYPISQKQSFENQGLTGVYAFRNQELHLQKLFEQHSELVDKRNEILDSLLFFQNSMHEKRLEIIDRNLDEIELKIEQIQGNTRKNKLKKLEKSIEEDDRWIREITIF